MSDAFPHHGTGRSDAPSPRSAQALDDAHSGRFEVQTITGSYLVDLTHRWLIRAPVTLRSGSSSLTWTFDIDGIRLPIVKLADCAVGRPMRATLRIGDADQPLRTSPVQTITVARPDGGNPCLRGHRC